MYFYCSSSISNFRDKLLKKYKNEWSLRHLFKPTIFFGCYHIGDYFRFFIHRGPKAIFWCGSDIDNLFWSKFWTYIFKTYLKRYGFKNYCENYVEKRVLSLIGIETEVTPSFFGDINKYPISYKHSNKPHVWLCSHVDRKAEYGVGIIETIARNLPDITFHIYGIKHPFHEIWFDRLSGQIHNMNYVLNKNIVYHDFITEKQLDKEIRNYQSGLRLNDFDGFSEVTAKSILMGQYPITQIFYPEIDQVKSIDELIDKLKELKDKKEPNYKAREYWYNELSKELEV